MQSILLRGWDREMVNYSKVTACLDTKVHVDVKCNRWSQLYALEGSMSQQLLFDEQKAQYNTLQLILQDGGCPLITPVSGGIAISISLLVATISPQGVRENLLEMPPLRAMNIYLFSFIQLVMQQEWDVCFCFPFCFRNVSVVEDQ